jgi:hypothetical protein
LLSSASTEANPFDYWRRDVAGFNENLLDENDPQRIVWRRMHGL